MEFRLTARALRSIRAGTTEHTAANPAAKATRFVVSVDYHGKPEGGDLTQDKDGGPSASDNWPDRVHYWIRLLRSSMASDSYFYGNGASAGYGRRQRQTDANDE